MFMQQQYFYQFLEPVSEKLAQNLKELEGTIFTNPRAMITHSRVLIENIINKVVNHEKSLSNINQELPLFQTIDLLHSEGLFEREVLSSLHEIRKLGNQSSHNIRNFRYSEALLVWEHMHVVMSWYVEVYMTYKVDVPIYQDPIIQEKGLYDAEEVVIRLKEIEKLFKESMNEEALVENQVDEVKQNISELQGNVELVNEPGLTTVRTLYFKEETLEVPYCSRDKYLIPQRFEKAALYVERLNGAQEARFMSELPLELDNLHERVKRFNQSHTEAFFNELKLFIHEEKRREKLKNSRPGELFLFLEGDEIIVTERLAEVEITKEVFTGIPSLIDFLHRDGIFKIGDLPKEFVILGKYKNIGITWVRNLFNQIKQVQEEQLKEVNNINV